VIKFYETTHSVSVCPILREGRPGPHLLVEMTTGSCASEDDGLAVPDDVFALDAEEAHAGGRERWG
jgi:hypothetical protein